MSVFEAAFGVPAGHRLREVRCALRTRQPRSGIWEWEHEESDEHGVLVAVYESWTRGLAGPSTDGIVCWVKYSPYGWVLWRVGAPPIDRIGVAEPSWPEAA